MFKAASIILLGVVAMAVGNESEEIVLNSRGCPIDTMAFKIMRGSSCNKFIKCSNGEPFEFLCPEPLLFNREEEVCDWPQQVVCQDQPTTAPSQGAEETTAIALPDDSNPATICAQENSEGLLVPHEYCNRLYMCSSRTPVDIKCPEPLLFNVESKLCDWEANVNCGDRLSEQPSVNQEKK